MSEQQSGTGTQAPVAEVHPVTATAVPSAAYPDPPHVVTVAMKVWVKALALEEPTGGYSVIVPALPGCVTQGDDIEEVQANIVEAVEGWLDSQHDARRDEALRSMLP
jgi:predicted RNase H-like HicB family nuclease